MRPPTIPLVAMLALACTRDPQATIGPAPPAEQKPLVVKEEPAPSTPERSWAALLSAMERRDQAQIERLTTQAGLESLKKGAGTEPHADAFARWGKGWAQWETRWKKRTATRADAVMGPEVKEAGLVFVLVDGVWKLDKWSPGE